MNGLSSIAQNLAAEGRGNDSMLVHMSPREVKGLQSLAMAAGGSLTVNPKTGLPEAGFLENLLPTLIGVGLSFVPGLSPVGAGLITGGLETVRTGDLGRGLMAGLGAYGGAGLGGSLQASGTQAAQAAAMQGEVANQAAAASGLPVDPFAATGQLNVTPSPLELADFQRQAASSSIMGTEAGASAINQAAADAAAKFQGQNMFSQLGQGTQAAFSQPGQFMTNLGTQFPSTTGKVAAGIGAINAISPPPKPMEIKPEESNYAGPYVPSPRQVRYPDEDRYRRDTSEFSYFTPTNPVPGFMPMSMMAEGGMAEEDRSVRMAPAGYQHGSAPEFNYNFRPVELPPGFFNPPKSAEGLGALQTAMMGNPMAEASTEIMGRLGLGAKNKQTPMDISQYRFDPRTQSMVPTTVQLAQGGSTGRFLSGPGDGTSDSIPAMIGTDQPARLADGEFVIDARTVSELGNGSSKAGAKKLYAMMDRVHSARSKADRGEDSKAARHLPA
jgi:hypothetical protein